LSTLWSRRQRELDTFAVGLPVNKERGNFSAIPVKNLKVGIKIPRSN
jgi:hypothetical protein